MATLTTSWKTYASKPWTHSSGAKIIFYLEAKYTSQSNANNTSSGVYTRLRTDMNVGSASGAGYEFTCSYCDKVSGSGVWTFEDETIMTSPAKTITHNTDGSKSLSLSATAKNNYLGINISLSATVDLPKIDRLATVTIASDFTDEENPTLEFTNPAGFIVYPYLNFYDNDNKLVHQLIRNSESATSPYTWDITDEERTALWKATNKQASYKVNVGVDTYNGTNKLGNNSKPQTMTYVNAEPTYTYTIVDENTKVTDLLGESAEYLVQNVSQPKITIVPTAKKEAKITNVGISYNGVGSIIQSEPYEKSYVANSTDFLVRVYDSRLFYVGQDTITRKIIEYSPINIDSFSFKRENPTSSNIILNAQIRYKQATFGSSGAIVWNGDTADREVIDTGSMQYYKVSELTPTKEELIGKEMVGNINDEYEETMVITESDITDLSIDNSMFIILSHIVVVRKLTTIEGVTYSAGIYFMKFAEWNMYISKLDLSETSSIDNIPTIQWKLGADGELNVLTTDDYTIDTDNDRITISNLVLSDVLPHTEPGEFYLYVNDLLTSDNENAYPVTKGIPTCDMGEHDFNVNGELYIANENRENKKEIRDLFFPIGSTYVTSTNESPANYLGGTWDLVDKEFKSEYEYLEDDNTTFPYTNISGGTLRVNRGGHVLNLSFFFTLSAALSDTSLVLTTLALSELGITKIAGSHYVTGYTDGGNATTMLQLHEDGKIEVDDIVPESSVASGNTMGGVFNVVVPFDRMIDSFCDKFYWKRTA